jgi:putative SOS response-associated peptidase YedK
MCYSAMVWQDYHSFVRKFGARLSIEDFVRLFEVRENGGKVKLPKGMEDAFRDPSSVAEKAIYDMVRRYRDEQRSKHMMELIELGERLAKAQQSLTKRVTKKATDDVRIASKKIAAVERRLADLDRDNELPKDSRIYPGDYAPVMIVQNGERLVVPMRYQCRVAGKPAFYDEKFPGTYNARMDNLEGFWRDVFGKSHGIAVVSKFYEHVQRIDADGKPQNAVLEFRPEDGQELLVACLWSRWTGDDGEELLSFAAITTDPPPEVLAAGHDRCIVPIKAEHLDAWLQPEGRSLGELYAILEDRARPFYQYEVAE